MSMLVHLCAHVCLCLGERACAVGAYDRKNIPLADLCLSACDCMAACVCLSACARERPSLRVSACELVPWERACACVRMRVGACVRGCVVV